MPAKSSPKEEQRRLKAFEETIGPAHPTGSVTLAAKALGDITPASLSKWLLQRGVRTEHIPTRTRQECLEGLKAFILRHKKIPSRDAFNMHSGIGIKWKTHWPTWGEFLEAGGVCGDTSKILLLDIETAPNRAWFWGGTWKQNINPDWIDANGYVLCWTAKWLGEKDAIFHRLKSKNHKALLYPIHKLLNEAQAVIHYNGAKFDVPTLNKEFLTHGMKPPSPYKNIDLLKTMWQTFLFPSNKLDYICKTLDIGAKLRHEGPQLWMDCMDDDPKAWEKMEAYNRRDVELLEQLYKRLLPWIKGHPNRAAMSGLPVCPACGSSDYEQDGTHLAQLLKYRRFQCADCGAWFRTNRTVSPRGERLVAAV